MKTLDFYSYILSRYAIVDKFCPDDVPYYWMSRFAWGDASVYIYIRHIETSVFLNLIEKQIYTACSRDN